MKKLQKANEIVRNAIKANYDRDDWRYADFVNHDRFLHEIKGDPNINLDESSAEEIAEYALEEICKAGILDFIS